MDEEFVYSTDEGDLRKQKKGQKKRSRGNAKTPPGIKNDGTIRVQRESKGRGGKTVSVLYGMPVSEEELQEWATKLKQQCGTGGSVKSGTIIIQGDKVDIIVSILENAGFSAKRAGG
ncbi:MAG: translation initiation factor [Spirochaetia bacterium]